MRISATQRAVIALTQILDYGDTALLSLEMTMIAGEPANATLVQRWIQGTASPSQEGRDRLEMAARIVEQGLRRGLSKATLHEWFHRYNPDLGGAPFTFIRANSGSNELLERRLIATLNQPRRRGHSSSPA